MGNGKITGNFTKGCMSYEKCRTPKDAILEAPWLSATFVRRGLPPRATSFLFYRRSAQGRPASSRYSLTASTYSLQAKL